MWRQRNSEAWPRTEWRLSGLLILVCFSVGAAAQKQVSPSLDHGFRQLYNLNFFAAQQQFTEWQARHPSDPMGPVAEAAGLLFSELHRLGVLEAQFFVKDSSFRDRREVSPDGVLRESFEKALARAQSLAEGVLAGDAGSREGLLALTLASGLRADYAALIEKRNLASLEHTRAANLVAERLLALHPDCYDAYLATGLNHYIVGSLPAPLRWVLRLGGYRGDKQRGLEQLRLTAERGRYLGPFARMLLAIAHLRDKDSAGARDLLAALKQEFPGNSLFAREVARLDARLSQRPER